MRVRSPVKSLSGGERNRLLLARLFIQPANLLVMDEPTNDLDVETLELLEELLCNYDGTLILVSHDRTFLDNVVTSTFAFEGDGVIHEYVGGYEDWLRQSKSRNKQATQKNQPGTKPETTPATGNTTKKTVAQEKPKAKLSYKDQRELDALPGLIEKLETEQLEIQAVMAEADFYKQDASETTKVMARLAELEKELEAAYQRWDELG